MAKKDNLTFRKTDLIAIAVVALVAVFVLLCFLPPSGGSAVEAQIYLNGELFKTVDLKVDQEFSIDGEYSSLIRVKDSSIMFADSDCPGRDCVHSGSIKSSGKSLVCLPNRVEIRVISDKTDVDFVVG